MIRRLLCVVLGHDWPPYWYRQRSGVAFRQCYRCPTKDWRVGP